jgi:hypothetical protein
LFAQEAESQPDRSLQSAGLQNIIDFPERGQILVLREWGSPLGMINLLFTVSTALGGRVAILEDMVVHPDHRGSVPGRSYYKRPLISPSLSAVVGLRFLPIKQINQLNDSINDMDSPFRRWCL